jgi:hypothetical protein
LLVSQSYTSPATSTTFCRSRPGKPLTRERRAGRSNPLGMLDNAGDVERLRELLEQHPGLEREAPGGILLGAAAQPEAGTVPRDIVDILIEAGSELDVPLTLTACFDKADMVGWLLDAGADADAVPIWGITPLQTATYHGARSRRCPGRTDWSGSRRLLSPRRRVTAGDSQAGSTPTDGCDRRQCASGPFWPTSAGRLRRQASETASSTAPARLGHPQRCDR